MDDVTDKELEEFLDKDSKCEKCKKEMTFRYLSSAECNCPSCDMPHFLCSNCRSSFYC